MAGCALQQVGEGEVGGREHLLELVTRLQAVVEVVGEHGLLVKPVVGLVELHPLGVLEEVYVVVVAKALELAAVGFTGSPEVL